MATMWSNAGDIRHLKHFRVTIDSSGYNTGTGDAGGGVTPNGNFPSTKYPYITNLSSLATSLTRATTNANALKRERGLMRWENVVRQLQREANCEIFDIEIVEANGDAQGSNLQFTVGYEDLNHLDLTGTSIDGSTANNTAILRIKELVAFGINNGTGVVAADANGLVEKRSVFRPGTTDTVIQEVTASTPTTTGEIFDSITVAEIGTTKVTSTSDN